MLVSYMAIVKYLFAISLDLRACRRALLRQTALELSNTILSAFSHASDHTCALMCLAKCSFECK